MSTIKVPTSRMYTRRTSLPGQQCKQQCMLRGRLAKSQRRRKYVAAEIGLMLWQHVNYTHASGL